MADDLTPSQQAAALHGLATNPTVPIADRLSMALQALDWYMADRERTASAVADNPPEHAFDEQSVIDPATGQPYPLWAGTEPQEWPDPYCVCGALWLEGECSSQVESLRAAAAKLRGTLGEVLSQLREKGHPGEPCVRTGWIRESTVVGWHQVYRETS